ncbi:MAG TPA: phosphatase PAP2 family protein [Acidimicrobiales bacterium]|nr:phosphatase PAP2 family protein [Acidimicrobiales bacterium]
MSLLPRGAPQGTTWFGKTGDIVQQPPVWAALAGALAWGGGDRGRRAAVRGTACYGATAIVGNIMIKPLVTRSRPPGAGENRTGPVTSSFPSGHAASDLAFTLAVSQEMPALFIALAPATMAAHWSLVRSRGHYASDVFAGGVLAVAVVLLAWRIWPPGPPTEGANNDNDGQKRPMCARARPTTESTPAPHDVDLGRRRRRPAAVRPRRWSRLSAAPCSDQDACRGAHASAYAY